jgi:hypothetical protein
MRARIYWVGVKEKMNKNIIIIIMMIITVTSQERIGIVPYLT